ncbi:ribonuclease T2 family protein [Acinetobacter nectaris]|uniref:ribonuclease T2 family protein n=1 Tax=Acinetobacter nectaris TaxID=1219382 RepID=UPI001F2111A0|nr:ribonuclease I [Acinetobacter nectaris]MCF8999705.1 ribonuclease I [Acinetobacter nectaris]MCF9028204.1 ribonuclease I [Acinetobacter nectaris]
MSKGKYLQYFTTYALMFIVGTFGCYFISSSSQAAKLDISEGYVLNIQMTPAVCAFDQNQRKQRKCLEGYALTIGSLVPENFTRNNDACATDTSAVLSPLQSKVVARVIPDESYRVQLWHAVGGCVPMNAPQYFRTIINYAQNLKIPAVLTDTISHAMSKQSLEEQFLSLNKGLPAKGIQLNCQKDSHNAVLTHISICYKNNGQFKTCPTNITSNCPPQFNIQGTY